MWENVRLRHSPTQANVLCWSQRVCVPNVLVTSESGHLNPLADSRDRGDSLSNLYTFECVILIDLIDSSNY